MGAKSTMLYARIEPQVKEKAEEILDALGMTASGAINLYYKQIILHQGIPFPVELPKRHPLSFENVSSEELDRELERGLEDMAAGLAKPADQVFSEFYESIGL